MKRKQTAATTEMTEYEQINALHKMKANIDKEKAVIIADIADAATEEVMCAQSSQDTANKALLEILNGTNKMLDAANITLGD